MSSLVDKQKVLDIFAEMCDATRPYHEAWQAVLRMEDVDPKDFYNQGYKDGIEAYKAHLDLCQEEILEDNKDLFKF